MIVQHRNGNPKGAFFIEEGVEQLAEMSYSIAGPDIMIIDHTEVEDKLRGKGAGIKMLLSLTEYARKNNYKIVPLCPFAKSVFDKREDLRDILK
ncbi:MAG TPA: GNAT family N-acetyltransferase [Bacteroidia bacterium]|nr:GNAT family N-acetyltransferase [Bacteroidia bacterium]